MRKFTQEEVEKIYEEKGYKVLSEYKNGHELIDIVDIKTGYMFQSSLNHFKKGELREPFGHRNKKFQKYNIELFLKNNHPNIKFISIKKQRKNGKTRNIVTFECECGNKFTKEWTHVIHDKRLLCPICAKKAQTEKKRKSIDEDAIKKIESFGYHFENKPEHIYGNELVEVVQNDTGYKVMVTATQLEKKKTDNIFSDFTNRHNLIYNLNKYIENNDFDCEAIRIAEEKGLRGGRSIIEYQCSCGRMFYETAHRLKKKQGRCTFCNYAISKNENKTEKFLKSLDIDYKMQYRFNSCKDKKPLPFDFHLTKLDILIEIDGEQHYRPIRFNGISVEKAEENFKKQKRRDKIKDNFCKNNNIPLLRIPYWEFDKEDTYKQTILNFIKTVQD